MYQPPFQAAGLLILRHTVAVNLIMPYGILIDTAAIARITLYGGNSSVLNLTKKADTTNRQGDKISSLSILAYL